MSDVRVPPAGLEFAGLKFRGLRCADLFPQEGVFKFIVTVNADFIVTSTSDMRFRRLISANLSTFDGQVKTVTIAPPMREPDSK